MKYKKKDSANYKKQGKKKSKLSVFLASALPIAVIAILIIVSIIISGLNDGSDPPTNNPITKDADEVVYYYSVINDEKELVLTLKRGWSFTIEGDGVDGVNKSGKYSVEGDVITLDFVRDSDADATATIKNENELKVVLNGATCTFRKKVSFTVYFVNPDNTVISTASVINGKTAAKPDTPEKEGYVFEGWYADSSCTVPFDFNKLITKNTSVYAKWTSS